MNSEIVIRTQALGKKYVIGHATERQNYTALRDVIGREARNILRNTSSLLRGRAVVGNSTEEFWALKGVNFEIKRGEVVGIVGRNGAGKSTLLKVLSRITEPTEGSVEIRGRVASLLEVGTGFHPELTGRENIYLNGAILGMSQAEIRRNFDEIVAFAEVEKFLDTPVKRYSSGMYVRLAFAVAAHLEPEILVIDEVLAVGDAQFQKKCLNRVSTITNSGRTVLFVSHNIAAIKQVCGSCIYLKRGSLHHAGSTDEVTRLYSADQAQTNRFESALKLANDLEIVNLTIADGYVESGSRARFELVLRALVDTELSDLTLVVKGPAGDRVAIIDCRTAHYPIAMKTGVCLSFCGTIESVPLIEGLYNVEMFHRTLESMGTTSGLTELVVVEPAVAGPPIRYPSEYRGYMALNFSLEAVKVVSADSLATMNKGCFSNITPQTLYT